MSRRHSCQRFLSAGYNVDFTDADTINRLGIHHSILVLPPTDRLPIETLRKVASWVRSGGHVLAVGRAPLTDASGTAPEEFATLAKETFAGKFLVPDPGALEAALHAAVKPDLDLKGSTSLAKEHLGFIRRRLPDADIYFIANTSNTQVRTQATLASRFRNIVRLNPESGLATEGAQGEANGELNLDLAPYESALYVVSNQPRQQLANSRGLSEALDLSHDWTLTFTSSGQKAGEPTLTEWTADKATIHYSGEAIYSRDFILPSPPRGSMYLQIDGGAALPEPSTSTHGPSPLGTDGLPDPKNTLPGPGMRATFDPPVREAALVTVNGRPAGALWHPPYRLALTELLRSGTNHIEIHVYNTALNAWSAQPPRDYAPLSERYGNRFQMQDLDQVKPISSGLLGTIRLMTTSP